MRVDVDHKEITKGFLSRKKYHQVTFTAYFTEEEKQVIEESGLDKEIIIDIDHADRPRDENDSPYRTRYTLRRAVQGPAWEWLGADKGEAQNYERIVMGRFKELSEEIKAYQESGGPQSGSYEF